jgi:hypothetical protein
MADRTAQVGDHPIEPAAAGGDAEDFAAPFSVGHRAGLKVDLANVGDPEAADRQCRQSQRHECRKPEENVDQKPAHGGIDSPERLRPAPGL